MERKVMPHCPKCGSEVDEKMVFCPKCGAPLRTEQLAALRDQWRTKRREWREQRSLFLPSRATINPIF